VLRGQQNVAARLSLDWSRLEQVGSEENRSGRLGLAYHQAVAARLKQQTVADAKYVLYRWREQGRIDPHYTKRWDEVLSLSLREIRDTITAVGTDADDLRQNSPFAGALSEPVRQRVLAEVG
jgi:arginyl-tRNA synthetase